MTPEDFYGLKMALFCPRLFFGRIKRTRASRREWQSLNYRVDGFWRMLWTDWKDLALLAWKLRLDAAERQDRIRRPWRWTGK